MCIRFSGDIPSLRIINPSSQILTDSFNFYLVSWFERARTFVTVIDPEKNKFLMSLLEDFFDSALVICKCSNEGKKELVNLFLPELGNLVTEANICCALRQEALRTLNSILDSVSREERKKFPLSEEMCSLTKDLAKTILEVGDYDLQVALSEALCRLMTKKWRDDLVHHWFEDNYLAEAFKEIKDREFETDCRKFLNQLNERLGDDRRVYSFPCRSAFADMKEVKKPSDEKLEEFWIDFNTGSQSVTFYVDSNEGALWDSVRLSKDAVSGYSLTEDDGEKIVKIYMKIPAAFNKTEATKIKISFSAEFEILSILRKVLGDEKMMINVPEEESIHAGKPANQNEAVIPVSTDPQHGKDPSNSENTETVFDKASQQSQQLTGTVAKGATRVTRKRRTSLAKQKTEGRKGIYDFENSDSASHEKVAEAKAKILGQKASSQKQRNYETRNKNEKSDILERRQSSYRKHLFSESNNENTSTGQSEKSWILDAQKQPLPKSLDYTRKRPRVRSRLKVLPMSSASSGSDDQMKKRASRQKAQKEEMPGKKSTPSSNGDDLPTVNLSDEAPSEIEGSPLLLDVPDMGSFSDAEATQKFLDVSGKSSREEESTKRKDSDILSGTIIKKPKLSSWETSNLFSDISHKPRKLFNSEENEEEFQPGQEMDDSVDNASFSKMLNEDFTDSGMIAAFENFISQLKKSLWSRYKRMEATAQNALRASEKNVSTLLNQILESRLSKLETLQKIVAEELANLEKETQILTNMEKDAVDFWNTQLFKLNSFCNQQKQRIQSVDSALGESAESFANTTQNTTYEPPVKKAVEKNVFIVPSD
ncbi:synaptonemal complex protein 2-like [Patagioenas fasciata]|uniref:synaptonemal complex protein 2-like n=1 Tax=Patagioenas fasciata TaxID=372321 RepID=UPI0032E8C243